MKKLDVKMVKVLFQGVMTLLMFAGMYLLMNMIVNKSSPIENKEIVYSVMSYLSGALSASINYWFKIKTTQSDKELIEDEK
jgi:hypothetical protein